MLCAALSGLELEVTSGESRGSTYPPPVPPFLLKCVRGSLEASFSSSVHSRSHSSSVYTSPDWQREPAQEQDQPHQDPGQADLYVAVNCILSPTFAVHTVFSEAPSSNSRASGSLPTNKGHSQGLR
ncbi:hypothetical protein P7K49_012832, partial [Saguinus oedipus]